MWNKKGQPFDGSFVRLRRGLRTSLLFILLAIIVMIGALFLISLSPRFHLEEELAILQTRVGQFSAQWPRDTFSIWYWDGDGEHNIRLWPPWWR